MISNLAAEFVSPLVWVVTAKRREILEKGAAILLLLVLESQVISHFEPIFQLSIMDSNYRIRRKALSFSAIAA